MAEQELGGQQANQKLEKNQAEEELEKNQAEEELEKKQAEEELRKEQEESLVFSSDEEIKKMQIKALQMHEDFDEKRQSPSFHNYEHIFSTVLGSLIFWSEALKENGKDPFNLREDLRKWNEENNGDISFEELGDILRLVFSFHDLGNIADVLEDEIVFHKDFRYKAEGAEARSKEIARVLINTSSLSEEKKKRYLPLILYLIEETKFDFTDDESVEKPFAVFIRVVDQIISGYLRKDSSSYIEGLANEIKEERGEEVTFDKEESAKFKEKRFPLLLEDETKRKEVLEILFHFLRSFEPTVGIEPTV